MADKGAVVLVQQTPLRDIEPPMPPAMDGFSAGYVIEIMVVIVVFGVLLRWLSAWVMRHPLWVARFGWLRQYQCWRWRRALRSTQCQTAEKCQQFAQQIMSQIRFWPLPEAQRAQWMRWAYGTASDAPTQAQFMSALQALGSYKVGGGDQ